MPPVEANSPEFSIIHALDMAHLGARPIHVQSEAAKSNEQNVAYSGWTRLGSLWIDPPTEDVEPVWSYRAGTPDMDAQVHYTNLRPLQCEL